MDSSLCFPDLQPLTENIMSVMYELKKKKVMDDTLFANLDFAERFLRDHPLRNKSKLLVKGNYSCVQMGKSCDHVFTVTSENNQTYVNVRFSTYADNISAYSIDSSHFFNHTCQDEIKSCFTQAKEAVPKGGLKRLHIICNRFSVTYFANFDGPGPTVETKCQLKLENLTAEGLLNKKTWLQKEKPTCHGLIACLNHLLKHYLTNRAPSYPYRFILHGDNETIIITSGEGNEGECVLLHDHEGVSMYPPTLF